MTAAESLKNFCRLPSVGVALAHDLRAFGVQYAAVLNSCDAQQRYQQP